MSTFAQIDSSRTYSEKNYIKLKITLFWLHLLLALMITTVLNSSKTEHYKISTKSA